MTSGASRGGPSASDEVILRVGVGGCWEQSRRRVGVEFGLSDHGGLDASVVLESHEKAVRGTVVGTELVLLRSPEKLARSLNSR